MRLFGAILTAAFLLWAGWDAGAAMPGGGGTSPSLSAEGAKKEPAGKRAPAPGGQVRRVTKLVDRIEGGVLYTETGTYSLKGVRVLDLTRNLKRGSPGSAPKKTAEMTFVNQQLKEVVLRQRR